MKKDYSSSTDIKTRWGGFFENPYISKTQRNLLDGFKVKGLRRIVHDLSYQSLLDIGCGWGEYSRLKKGLYVGIDNSFRRLDFALRANRHCSFSLADAARLPFKNRSFDAVLLANTIHHLSDSQFLEGLREMQRISRKYIIIDDCVVYEKQGVVSRFFYSLDRGLRMRSREEIRQMLARVPGLRILEEKTHVTFPGLYCHAVFIVDVLGSF